MSNSHSQADSTRRCSNFPFALYSDKTSNSPFALDKDKTSNYPFALDKDKTQISLDASGHGRQSWREKTWYKKFHNDDMVRISISTLVIW